MQIVLFEPEIPPNTGNIARLCAATGTVLHLVKPLGFAIQDRYLRRAGLDYWPKVSLLLWENWEHFNSRQNPLPLPPVFQAKVEAPLCPDPAQRLIMVSSKKRPQSCPFHLFDYKPSDVLVFGPETRGLPDQILSTSPVHVRVPMRPDSVRSLNLSTCAGIVLYTALIHCGLPGEWC